MTGINQTQERTPCEVWSRCMGYYRPMSHYNPGKKSEHYSRVYFKVDEAMLEDNAKFKKEFGNGNLES